jgi:hypothetical protein
MVVFASDNKEPTGREKRADGKAMDLFVLPGALARAAVEKAIPTFEGAEAPRISRNKIY